MEEVAIMATTTVSLENIDVALQQQAERVFAEEGITASDVYRQLLLRTVEAQHIPLDLFTPNVETIEAMKAARRGEVFHAETVEELMAQLHADD
jgi:DNA-damage-inducible protein J